MKPRERPGPPRPTGRVVPFPFARRLERTLRGETPHNSPAVAACAIEGCTQPSNIVSIVGVVAARCHRHIGPRNERDR